MLTYTFGVNLQLCFTVQSRADKASLNKHTVSPEPLLVQNRRTVGTEDSGQNSTAYIFKNCACAISTIILWIDTLYGPRREKTCLRRCANNKGADQPVHPHSLISAFIIRLLESIISMHATSKILIFLLVTVCCCGD